MAFIDGLAEIPCDCSNCKNDVSAQQVPSSLSFSGPGNPPVEVCKKPAVNKLSVSETAKLKKLTDQIFIETLDKIDFNDNDTFGGKATSLGRMIQQGLPVPPGFVIPTAASRLSSENLNYFSREDFVRRLMKDVRYFIKGLEVETGKVFGKDLFVSVRSGAPVSMPGMMDTVLNVGISKSAYKPFMKTYNSADLFIRLWQSFLQQYGSTALGMTSSRLNQPEQMFKEEYHIDPSVELTQKQKFEMIDKMELRIRKQFYQEILSPYEALEHCIKAVLDSWDSERAKIYRKQNNISNDLGTAVSIVAMVYGNASEDSGTGVCFTRNPSTGEKVLYGEYLAQAQGEDIVSGKVTPKDIDYLAENMPEVFGQLVKIAADLETNQQDVQDIEFTVENGKLWLLQHRAAKRTNQAAIRIAVDMANEGLITREEAVKRVPRMWLDAQVGARFDEKDMARAKAEGNFVGIGTPASGGIATGFAAFNTKEVESMVSLGMDAILFRKFTTPDDLGGMLKAKGIVTLQGGSTSHAAVVARELNKPCIVGITAIEFNEYSETMNWGSEKLSSTELISICGTDGSVFMGGMKESRVREDLESVNAILKEWHEEFNEVIDQEAIKISIALPSCSGSKQIPVGLQYKTFRNKCWWPELTISLNLTKMCADFYTLADMAKNNIQYKRALSEYSSVVAKEMAVYLDAAVGGEARHMRPNGFMGMNGNQLSRTLARKEWREIRIKGGMEPLHKLVKAYHDYDKWGSSFGGKQWARITELLVAYLEGQITPTIFVDLAFDLEHNCGGVFSKLSKFEALWDGQEYVVGWNLDNLKEILNAKFVDNTELVRNYCTTGMMDVLNTIDSGKPVEILVEDYENSHPQIVDTEAIAKGATVTITNVSKSKTRVGDTGIIVGFTTAYKKRVARVRFSDNKVGMFVLGALEPQERSDRVGVRQYFFDIDPWNLGDSTEELEYA